MKLAGKSQPVHYISTKEYQERFKDYTPKPAYSVLNTDRLKAYTTIRPWQDALAEYMQSLSSK